MAQATTLSRLKEFFFRGDIVTKVLIINVAIYMVVQLADIILSLFAVSFSVEQTALHWLALPAHLIDILHRPWTLITGFFFHIQLFHILFNMLWLFWFGRMFLSRFNTREFGGLYFFGGLFGGIVFILAYNLFPLLKPASPDALLIGASGAILSIVVATATAMPMMQVRTLFGAIRLKYIALVVVVLSVLELNGTNPGGNFAHLGGALAGYFYVVMQRKKIDLLYPYNKVIDFFVTAFRPKPKMKIKYNRPSHVDYDYREQKKQDTRELDAILDKLKQSGYNSLTKEEKQKLFEKGR